MPRAELDSIGAKPSQTFIDQEGGVDAVPCAGDLQQSQAKKNSFKAATRSPSFSH